MTTVISGSSPSITFSDTTTQTTAFTSTPSVTSITTSADSKFNGVTVGIGSGNSLNTAVGLNALVGPNTNAQQSLTAVGYAALNATTNSWYTTAIGAYSMLKTTATSYSTAVGAYTLYNQTTGTNNTAIGNAVLYGLTTGTDNVGVGNSVMGATTVTGQYNVGVGNLSIVQLTYGEKNTAVGHQALNGNSTASGNTGVGYQALYTNSSGSYNVAVGREALQSSSTGSENTAVGYQALSASNGGFCTAFGFKSGNTITTGYGDVMLGYMCQPSAATTAYEIVIGTVGGNCYGKGGATGFIAPNAGGVYQGNNSATWSVTSDQRLKKNIVDNNVGLEKISQIQVRNFEYRTEDEVTELPKNQVIKKEGIQLGAIAQEIQAILPDCVKEETTGVLSVNSDSIMWHMINAIKELNAKVIALETKLGV
jgi:hypothetical protein